MSDKQMKEVRDKRFDELMKNNLGMDDGVFVIKYINSLIVAAKERIPGFRADFINNPEHLPKQIEFRGENMSEEKHYVEEFSRSTNATGFVQSYIERYKTNPSFDVGQISDGFHTFDELYHHRAMNYLLVCRLLSVSPGLDVFVWRSRAHNDGTSFEGWFVLGVGSKEGEQITYHLADRYWNHCDFAETFPQDPCVFDGHSSSDVLQRLETLLLNI